MNAYLITGTNIGNRLQNLQQALFFIIDECGVLINTSQVYETAAWGNEDQQAFYNQVIIINTNLSPQQLIASLLNIEKKLGRIRNEKYGPRVIDIDILFLDDLIINKPDLIVPHPHLQTRKFVLMPLHEVAANFVHPALDKTIHTLMAECTDTLNVQKI